MGETFLHTISFKLIIKKVQADYRFFISHMYKIKIKLNWPCRSVTGVNWIAGQFLIKIFKTFLEHFFWLVFKLSSPNIWGRQLLLSGLWSSIQDKSVHSTFLILWPSESQLPTGLEKKLTVKAKDDVCVSSMDVDWWLHSCVNYKGASTLHLSFRLEFYK